MFSNDEISRKYGHLTVEQYPQAIRESQERALSRALSRAKDNSLDTGSGSGKGFTFEVNDIQTIEHIQAIFRAVDEHDIKSLRKLIKQKIPIYQSYTDHTVPVRDVVAALEHALNYAEINGLTEVVNTIAGKTVHAEYISYSHTVRDSEVEHSNSPSPR